MIWHIVPGLSQALVKHAIHAEGTWRAVQHYPYTMLIYLWSSLSQQVLFSCLELASCLLGIIYDLAAGICQIGCMTGNLPCWIKSCWQFIVKLQVSVLTSAAFPFFSVCVCAHTHLRVTTLFHCMEAGSRYVSLTLAKTGKDSCKTDIQRRHYWVLDTCKTVSRRKSWEDEGAHQYFSDRSEYRSVSGKAHYFLPK